jgi:exonuclease III
MISILTYNIHGLPWSVDNTLPIARWSGVCGAELLCFQEVFTESRKTTLKRILEEHNYTVYFPNDIIGSVVPSGLCIALQNKSLWKKVSTRFTPFFNYSYWDTFANKGFFAIYLQHKNGRHLRILNTHMQSDWELPYYSGIYYTNRLRRQQLEEMVNEYESSKTLTLIVGDLNQEGIIHPRVKNICCKEGDAITTFPSTGHNVDHIACISGTGLTPVLKTIRIGNEVPWSDHSPLVVGLDVMN